MKLYHYTSKSNLDSILTSGLKPGSEVKRGEQIGAVLLDSQRYQPQIGPQAYLEVEIREDDTTLRKINEHWFEYTGTVAAEQITAVANPPGSVDEFFRTMMAEGEAEANRRFDYIPVNLKEDIQ